MNTIFSCFANPLLRHGGKRRLRNMHGLMSFIEPQTQTTHRQSRSASSSMALLPAGCCYRTNAAINNNRSLAAFSSSRGSFAVSGSVCTSPSRFSTSKSGDYDDDGANDSPGGLSKKWDEENDNFEKAHRQNDDVGQKSTSVGFRATQGQQDIPLPIDCDKAEPKETAAMGGGKDIWQTNFDDLSDEPGWLHDNGNRDNRGPRSFDPRRLKQLDGAHRGQGGRLAGFVENLAEPEEDNRPFAQMLRESRFFQMGDPAGQVVVGQVTYAIANDLYVDFGGKFLAVVKRPLVDPEKYHSGARVLLRINDLELSSRFLGSDKDLTLLEADATLIGLARPRQAVQNDSA